LAHVLRLSGLWSQRRGDLKQPVSFARRHGELEPREKDADNHRRTNVRRRCGRISKSGAIQAAAQFLRRSLPWSAAAHEP
jgi:hypothetical protein